MTLRTATLLAAALTVFAGCGKPTKKVVTVTGTVTYGGHQLKSGVLKFEAPNGDFAIANITNGQFTMTDVVPGVQKVAYVGGPMGVGSSDGSKAGPAEKPVAVPQKFGDFLTSGVTVTVSDSGGEMTVELK
jgi:hypothetical protein